MFFLFFFLNLAGLFLLFLLKFSRLFSLNHCLDLIFYCNFWQLFIRLALKTWIITFVFIVKDNFPIAVSWIVLFYSFMFYLIGMQRRSGFSLPLEAILVDSDKIVQCFICNFHSLEFSIIKLKPFLHTILLILVENRHTLRKLKVLNKIQKILHIVHEIRPRTEHVGIYLLYQLQILHMLN